MVSVHGGPNEWLDFSDVVCTNSYNAWYAVSGNLEEGETVLEQELTAFRDRHSGKPIFLTEFGADANAGGLRSLPRCGVKIIRPNWLLCICASRTNFQK